MNRIVQFLIIRNDYFDEKKKERDARKAETKATTMYEYERRLSIDHLLVNRDLNFDIRTVINHYLN